MKAVQDEKHIMTNIIIERLNDLGFYETSDKSQRELIHILAAMDVKVDSPNNSWF